MLKDLLLNYYSIRDDGVLSDCEENGKTIMMRFLNTIRNVINSEKFGQYYISDLNFWSVALTPSLSFGEFFNSLTLDQKKWVLELKKLAQVPTDTFFSLELLEQVIDYTPRLASNNLCVDSLGCAACKEDLIVVSFATEDIWNSHKVLIQWYESDEAIDHAEYGLGNFFYNISTPPHIQEILSLFFIDDGPITHAKWLSVLPTTIPTGLFWNWFDTLTESAQKSLFRKTQDIQTRNWHARLKTSFQQLGDGICEIRCDLRGGGTARVYTKIIATEKVVLLAGSDKSGQEEAIKTAKKMAKAYS